MTSPFYNSLNKQAPQIEHGNYLIYGLLNNNWSYIFSYLSKKDLYKTSLVSKSFLKILSLENKIYDPFLQRKLTWKCWTEKPFKLCKFPLPSIPKDNGCINIGSVFKKIFCPNDETIVIESLEFSTLESVNYDESTPISLPWKNLLTTLLPEKCSSEFLFTTSQTDNIYIQLKGESSYLYVFNTNTHQSFLLPHLELDSQFCPISSPKEFFLGLRLNKNVNETEKKYFIFTYSSKEIKDLFFNNVKIQDVILHDKKYFFLARNLTNHKFILMNDKSEIICTLKGDLQPESLLEKLNIKISYKGLIYKNQSYVFFNYKDHIIIHSIFTSSDSLQITSESEKKLIQQCYFISGNQLLALFTEKDSNKRWLTCWDLEEHIFGKEISIFSFENASKILDISNCANTENFEYMEFNHPLLGEYKLPINQSILVDLISPISEDLIAVLVYNTHPSNQILIIDSHTFKILQSYELPDIDLKNESLDMGVNADSFYLQFQNNFLAWKPHQVLEI